MLSSNTWFRDRLIQWLDIEGDIEGDPEARSSLDRFLQGCGYRSMDDLLLLQDEDLKDTNGKYYGVFTRAVVRRKLWTLHVAPVFAIGQYRHGYYKMDGCCAYGATTASSSHSEHGTIYLGHAIWTIRYYGFRKTLPRTTCFKFCCTESSGRAPFTIPGANSFGKSL